MEWERLERLVKDGLVKSEDLVKMINNYNDGMWANENWDNLAFVAFVAVVGLAISYCVYRNTK